VTNENPLISVIIPCYNQGHFLSEAIESVFNQHFQEVEIIVVDDGSTDCTKAVVQKYPEVVYLYQANQGPSAARNAGICRSQGAYLVFLDADDWLVCDALNTNLQYLKANDEVAFVAGAHIQLNEQYQLVRRSCQPLVEGGAYANFLVSNYVVMHGAVMYRRWVFDHFRFDPALRGCEDYDLYLKVSREYLVVHHDKVIAAYRKYAQSASTDFSHMIETGLMVKKRQQDSLKNEQERAYLVKGMEFWKDYFCNPLYHELLTTKKPNREESLDILYKYRRRLYYKYFFEKRYMQLKAFIKSNSPKSFLRLLYKAGLYKGYGQQYKEVAKGDFNRVTPFSTVFGYDRGGPIDRYYIDNFLQLHADSIKGRVLEIGDNEYTLRFGRAKVTQSDVLHVEAGSPKATFVGDLCNTALLPAEAFDCIILTQTLHLIYNYQDAINNCYRILKPGGALLLTVPGISQIDHHEWKEIWFWSFTGYSLKRILSGPFPKEGVRIDTHGNVLVASAFLYGMGLPELKKEQVDYCDPHYQVTITALAVKHS
jgi:glycosyltransferase involved in cell wall biosynthesis